VPTPAWWLHWLARPEMALVADSCRAETALHRRLQQEPMREVAAPELAAIADPDARENYRHLLSLRDGVQAAGSLQAWVIAQFSHGVTVPPLFVDLALQAIVAGMLDEPPDPLQARAAELFFRTQRLSFEEGRVLAADLETLEEFRQSQGLGELGRLMAQAQVKALPAQLPVLGADTESRYWRDATSPHFRSSLLLDLAQEVSTDVGHGVHFKLGNARSGLKPLAVLLERWVRQLLGAECRGSTTRAGAGTSASMSRPLRCSTISTLAHWSTASDWRASSASSACSSPTRPKCVLMWPACRSTWL